MNFIAHRINSSEELKKIPQQYGVEVDLRDHGKRLILQHDPFMDGEDFEDYLKAYKHGMIILNIKSERIESRVLELVKKYDIQNYMLLDSSMPMIVSLSKEGEKNIAVRLSEFESIDTVIAFAGRVSWVWVDCFTYLPIDKAVYKKLKEAGLKICLVSPELQGRPNDIELYKKYIQENEIEFDLICTKIYNVPLWSI